jgi:hypothetical protein
LPRTRRFDAKENCHSSEADGFPPSLEQQLKDSGVIAGSALETLIKQNQDFSILDPSELNDNLPFPLWLRVFVRKTHPEVNFSGPRPGYPLILKEVLSYMVRHQDLPEAAPPAKASKRSSGR